MHESLASRVGRIPDANLRGARVHRSPALPDTPEVLIDYTFELWGEKHLIDPALLAAADLDWLSNVNDSEPDAAGPLSARILLYTRALSIPAETMLIGNLRAPSPSIEERLATELGAAPLLLRDLRKLSHVNATGMPRRSGGSKISVAVRR